MNDVFLTYFWRMTPIIVNVIDTLVKNAYNKAITSFLYTKF